MYLFVIKLKASVERVTSSAANVYVRRIHFLVIEGGEIECKDENGKRDERIDKSKM